MHQPKIMPETPNCVEMVQADAIVMSVVDTEGYCFKHQGKTFSRSYNREVAAGACAANYQYS